MKTLCALLIVLALAVPVVATAEFETTYIKAKSMDALQKRVRHAYEIGACISPFLFQSPLSEVSLDTRHLDKKVLVQPMLCDDALLPASYLSD